MGDRVDDGQAPAQLLSIKSRPWSTDFMEQGDAWVGGHYSEIKGFACT